jgi:hypothetical protein
MTIRHDSSTPREASAAAVRRAAHGALSMRARVGYVALLIAAACGAAGLVSLWATEPGLPARTHAAFAALTALCLAWAAIAAWILRTRRVLLGYDRVLAGRMAVTGAGLFTAGMVAAAAASGRPAAWGGVLLGAAMVAVAAVQLRRAARRVLELVAQRDALARELDAASIG